ncbi:MAG: enoyl-CoA hydratase/isomerase family protein [Acidobacteria bacterium]|nr:enoyl-CoA hydratase/isomerase family protein [Acidobacteriota bacterium]
MSSSNAAWDIIGSVGTLTFTRPDARNALTWEMYDALERACDRADGDPAVRALIIRGSGGSFAAGTDISQFEAFTSGLDGVEYERRLDAIIERVERVTVPTVAEIDGAAVGGGCLIAIACDVRLCSPRARLGVPVAKTLGNCLSIANTARLIDIVGVTRFRDLVMTGRLASAEEALAIGLVTRVVEEDQLADETLALALELSTRASSTIQATKAVLARLRGFRAPPPGAVDDIIEACYGSADFREGVAAFRDGRAPRFT